MLDHLPSFPPVQREILRRLVTRESLSFTKLRPEAIDSNLYSYHLKELVTAGYIEKQTAGYRLSALGRWYAGIISEESGLPRVMPKTVVMIALKNECDEYLFYRWKRQPFMDKVSLPYGKMHSGLSTLEAAYKELEEKTGLTAHLDYRGTALVRTLLDHETFNHMVVLVFAATSPEGTLTPSTRLGEVFWAQPQDILKTDWAPGTGEIIRQLEANQSIFFIDILTEA